jgi:MinD superfamily P-loop ATPase
VWFFETLFTVPFNPVWCYLKQPVNGFHVTDSCVACGKCEKLCPVNAIQIKDGRPVWKGKSCSHCMSCIQNCPTESIEYESITQEKERYQFSRYKGILETIVSEETPE